MKLNDIRVTRSSTTSSEGQDERSTISFEKREKRKEKPNKAVRGESMFIKIGLCGVAVLAALLVRTLSTSAPAAMPVEVAALSETEGEESLGALHFVDASQNTAIAMEKWNAPVISGDIELMLDNRMVRFTATASQVLNCCLGEVLSVAEDARLGKYVRVMHEGDVETIFYGFEEVSVKQTDIVQVQDVLGTVPLGRSVYMSVLKNGAPQDPAAFINLNLGVETSVETGVEKDAETKGEPKF